MPARDTYHDHVREALVKDGWTITDDPLHLHYGKKDMYADLGAERLLGAEKGRQKIAVEVKSFVGASEMRDLQTALGQYVLYNDVLAVTEPDRPLYLAVTGEVHHEVFEDPLGQLVVERNRLRLLVFDESTKEVRQWKPSLTTAN